MTPSSSSQTGHAVSDFANDMASQMEDFAPSQGIAEEAIARDLEDDDSASESSHGSFLEHSAAHPFSMINAYRRLSYVSSGSRSAAFIASSVPERSHMSGSWKKHSLSSKQEQEAARDEERDLLNDNLLLPSRRSNSASTGPLARLIAQKSSSSSSSDPRKVKSVPDEETGSVLHPSERTALLHDCQEGSSQPYGGLGSPRIIARKWNEAVAAGRIQTSWKREAKVLTRSSAPLILTFVLQYSLPVASIFTVGHIGKIELGAVSLASMTAGITGYSVYQGLATSLDTLCAQAYGSGRPHLVGLQLQRMLFFLLLVTVPISLVWAFGYQILSRIVPEEETARLAGLYLKILIAGAPAYAAFESGKRYLQAQGLFNPTMFILLICAPTNAFLNWYLVWHLRWGFVGAPTAVVITENLLLVLLLLYVRFVDGYQCWGGFDRRAFKNWAPMIKLALPGVLMILAEFMAFEILTLTSSWLGPASLAAQSILASVGGMAFQLPFPVSIAASTRIASLIGATLAGPAKTAASVGIVASILIGAFNLFVLSTFGEMIPKLFTNDADVIAEVATLLPLFVWFQVFDSVQAMCSGVLRGLGRQDVGGYVNLFAYYIVGLPLSLSLGFGPPHWGLTGLWTGPAVALGIVAAIEIVFIHRTDWDKAIEAATARNIAN